MVDVAVDPLVDTDAMVERTEMASGGRYAAARWLSRCQCQAILTEGTGRG